MNWQKKNFTISSDKEWVDIDALYGMLRQSYWARDRTREEVEQTVSNSICFSLYKDEEQIGFARVLTDEVAYAIILVMIIREDFRGQGLGRWLMTCMFEHPEIAPLRKRISEIEKELQKQKEQLGEIGELLSNSEQYKDSNKAINTVKEYHRLEEVIKSLTHEWEKLSIEAESIAQEFDKAKSNINP